MKKYILYVGLNDKDEKVQIISTDTAKDIIAMVCGDCTVYEAQGRYTHAGGDVVTEATLCVELLFKTEEEVKQMVYLLKSKECGLNQESIAVQCIDLVTCDLW